MAESIVTNEDCRSVMARYPDRHFFTIADPPYGLSITDRHREREREKERDGCLSEDQQGRSAVCGGPGKGRPPIGGAQMAKMKGESKSSLSSLRFILCSTIAPRRTQRHLGSYSV